VKNGAVYFAAIGGAGALAAECIVKSEVVAWPKLGPEALRRLTVRDLPLIVANDAHGGDLFEQGVAEYAVAEEAAAG
jgi:fumarate hydratase subunit beta